MKRSERDKKEKQERQETVLKKLGVAFLILQIIDKLLDILSKFLTEK